MFTHPSRRAFLSAIVPLVVCPVLNGQHAAAPQPKELAVLRGHTNVVWGLDMTPDGKTVVSGSFDKTIKVWDVATGKDRLTLRGHSRCVEWVTVTPDGKTAVAGDQAGVLRVWDLTAGRERAKLADIGSRPAFLSLSSDGRTVSLGDHNYFLRQWDLTTGNELTVGGGRRLQVNFVRGDGRVAAAAEERKPLRFVEVLDVPSGRVLTTVPARQPLAFTPDGKSLFTTDESDVEIHLWELATGQLRATTPGIEQRHIGAVAVHPHGRLLAVPREDVRAVWLVDLTTGKSVADLKIPNDNIHQPVFSADGRLLAVSEGPDTTIRVWDVSGLAKSLLRKDRLSPAELDALWADLAGADAGRAYQAIWALAGAMNSSAAWLGEHLKPIAAADARRTAKLIADLDNNRFAVRDRAARALEELAESAAPALRQTLTGSPSTDLRERIEALLRRLDTLPADRLRSLRAIEALEFAATPEARALLERLTAGLAEARLTREAKAAVERLGRR